MDEAGNAKSQQEHYVPQCYLKYFASNKDKNQIFVYDIATNILFKTNIKNIASKKNFYDSIEPEIQNKELEILFSKFETDYNTILEAVILRIEEKKSITQNMKEAMSLLLAFQMLRTESQRKYIGEWIDKMTKTTFEETHNLSEEDKIALYKLELNPDYVKSQHIEFMFDPEIIRTIIEALDKHIWIIGINNTSIPLYTSDNPVVRKSHKKDKIHSYSAFGSEGIEIAFPLTPKYILILKERRYFSNLKNKDNKINLSKY